MKERKSTILALLFFATAVQAQVIDHPNCGMKSPNTLVIEKVETINGLSTFYCSVENQINDGYFCADKNIYIVYSDGTKSKMISSKGIPNCPDTFK